MSRLAAAAVLLFAAPAVLAQAVTRPTVTVSAGALRASTSYSQGGDVLDGLGATAFSTSLGAEAPVWQRDATTVSAGATLVAASYAIPLDGGGTLLDGRIRPQRLDVFGRVGTEQASALIGVSVNLGRDVTDFDGPDEPFAFNSDGQNAVIAQLRYKVPAGRASLFAQVDAAFVPATRETFQVIETNPDGSGSGVLTARTADIDNGSPLGFQFGASVPAGPVSLGLSLFYATRTEGTFRIVGDEAPAFSNQLGYRNALGLIPSVAYRKPGGRVAVRAEGSFSDFFSMERTPVGLTVSGDRGPVVRPAVTVRVSVGL